MNHLLAKTKGRNGDFFKIISNKKIFDLPEDLDNPIQYDTGYNLEDDEWFAIDNFSNKDYCIDILKHRFVSTDYNQIVKASYQDIEYIFSYQSGVYYFQKISSSQVIRKKYFSFTEEPKLIQNEPIIIINTLPDAIYVKSNDQLFFKKLQIITSIFIGIEELYNEATIEETEEFLKNDFILLDNEYSAEKVKKANRKRIAMALATLSKYTDPEKKAIFSYIRDYCTDLVFDENDENFTISNEEDLKKLLFGIEQRYYTTLTGGERRLANSIIKL